LFAQVEFQPITDDPKLPRVLLIGDSVSIAYTLNVRSELAGVANVHRIAANGGSTKTALGYYGLVRWLVPTEKWDLIHFNHGLHDACYRFPDGSDKDANGNYASPTNGASPNVSLADYEKNLLLILPILRSTGAKLIFATTTSIPDSIVPKYVEGSEVPYNTIARRVMAAEGIPVNDLWDLSSKNYNTVFPSKRTFQIYRDVHFNPEGSLALGKQVAESIKRVLKPTFRTVFPQQEPSNDSDRDGIPAFIEYAVGGSSATDDGKLLPQAKFVGNTPCFAATVRNDDPSLQITPQFATSLNGPW
jgi:acyl-CoA thioesterase-1